MLECVHYFSIKKKNQFLNPVYTIGEFFCDSCVSAVFLKSCQYIISLLTDSLPSGMLHPVSSMSSCVCFCLPTPLRSS